MKNPIILFLALSFYAHCQSPPTFNVWAITPSVVCPGDTFKVNYKIGNPIATTVTTIYLQINNPIDTIWQGSYLILKAQKKQPSSIPNDSTYYKWFKMPTWRAQGSTTLITNSPMSYINVMQVKNCNLVGLPEESQEIEKPEYFDLYGNKIEPLNNLIMIEKVGIRRRKVLISGN